MRVTLFDRNEALCAAWRRCFDGAPEVSVICGDVAALSYHDAIVTSGNSFGVMTGGIDLAVRDMFGLGLQDAVQNLILQNAEPLPVGQAVFVRVEGGAHGGVIYAPTMYSPRRVPAADMIYVMIAAMGSALRNGCASVAVPGLGTHAGGVAEASAARAMRIGYDAALAYFEGEETENAEQTHPVG